MKIKTEKQLNLPQLIEWAVDNDIKHRVFESNPNFDGVTYKLGFNVGGDLYFEEPLTPTLLFTIEVEEELTENTVIPVMLAIGRKNKNDINIHFQCKISQFLDNEDFNYYVLNNDDTFTIIWRNGKLVE